ncbi:MAG: metallophosphoesterase family protein [Flavobacteriales bacterium]|nr:metallophosphoesterase family protein [Flavobacteriales bacterium]|tara:strand:+ start:276 stop:770 length:495 start_codon:yes stop_codon:yes gene_type:complete
MKKIILLSDTHNSLDKRFTKHFQNADEIWHAGDIGDIKIIDQLRMYAKVRAVWGNIDNHIIRSEFKENLFFKCEGMKVMMTHIGGYPGRYSKKIISIIEQANPDIFISGHSHILKVIYDKKNNLLHMNPGAMGDYGIHKVKTILSFIIEDEKVKNLNIIEFPRK